MPMPEFIRPEWQAPDTVTALVTTRGIDGASRPPFEYFNLGAHCGDDPAAVAHNRAHLLECANLPGTPHWLSQVHGVAVQQVESRRPEARPAVADAAVTRVPGAVLAILTADCLPVLFCAEDGSEVAAVHAGWRGLAAGVLEATVAAMQTPASRLLAWLGPAAGPARYEIGEEVRAAFVERDPASARCFVATRPGHDLIDLFALARQRLAAVGVERIAGGGLCTISDPQRFYSHRRDGRCGRMAALVWIKS